MAIRAEGGLARPLLLVPCHVCSAVLRLRRLAQRLPGYSMTMPQPIDAVLHFIRAP